MPRIRTLGNPDEELARYLARYDVKPEHLTSQIDELFGPVVHAVASGSVAAGYATPSSDLDLFVLVENPEVSQVPVVSHELGPLMDIFYFDATDVRQRLDSLVEPSTTNGREDPRQSATERRDALGLATRLAIGAVITSTPSWTETHAWMGSGWLTDLVTDWWRCDAQGRLTQATWLRDDRPVLAAQAALEAGISGLKAVATAEGFIYLPQKWIARELRALDRADLVETYRWLLQSAADPSRAADFVGEVEARLHDLIGPAPEDLVIEAAYLPAVDRREIGGRTVLWRWEMAGITLDVTGLPDPGSTAVFWQGGPGSAPPHWLHRLFIHGLVWIGARRAAV